MEFEQLVDKYRDRLKRLADLRLGTEMKGRVDSSDVIQEACIDALKQYDQFQDDPQNSGYCWLRFFVCQKIVQMHRKHIRTKSRDARREISIDRCGPQADSSILAIHLLDGTTTPSKIVSKKEMQDCLVEALDQLDTVDREVIALRNLEQLSVDETANILGLTRDAVYKRHSRAILSLKKIMDGKNHE